MQKFDKLHSAACAAAPRSLSLSRNVMSAREGHFVNFGNRSVKVVGKTARTLRLSNGVTMQTEDKFSGLNASNSYVHIKNGKRFVTYKVTGISYSAGITLRQVKLSAFPSAPAAPTAPARRATAGVPKSKVRSAVAAIRASLRKSGSLNRSIERTLNSLVA